ncbi:uncharacterized protein LOC114267215 [Camellia sinensis]|uniref:uncharacterized protein LOC114267215 n=1 Tax=Camellia sinensis TaxID=4442 RepID=UPI001036415B|nr:uncharacterized protein LOC114267215 [Camellia sinensis]
MITHGVVVVERWWLSVLIVLVLPLCYGDRVSISRKKLDDFTNYLKGFNKPPLKSIKVLSPLQLHSFFFFGELHCFQRKLITKLVNSLRNAQPNLINQGGHQHAIAYVEGDKFYGAEGTMNVWEPIIQQPNEFSLSQLWILGGSFASDLNSIETGWQVCPDLHGDNNTRLFTYWTSDAYQATGCYNLLCCSCP